MAPALRVPVSVNVAEFEKQMTHMADVTTKVVRKMAYEFAKFHLQIAAEKGAEKALGKIGMEALKAAYNAGLLGKALVLAARAAAPVALIVGTFKAIAEITEFARQKIEEFVKLQEQAAAAGVSTDFFQRWTKGAEEIGLKLDDATRALERFADASKSKLGGSDLQRRIDELKEAGNLGGISTKGFEGAIGNQDKLEAAAKIIREMLDNGERLAALDLAERAFGAKVADALRADASYLDQMLASAKAIEATKIISAEDINRAIDLTNRMNEAQKLLAEKWVPLQRQLLQLGIDHNESWINFYHNLAAAVSAATSLVGIFERMGKIIEQGGRSSFWTRFAEATGKLGLNTALPEEMRLDSKTTPAPLSPPMQQLAYGLKNPAAIKEQMRQMSEIQALIYGDKSKPTGGAKPTAAGSDFLATQNDQIEKHIGLLNAEADAVGLGVAKREELRTVALLTAAAEKDGVVVTEELKLAMQALGEQAGEAAERLAKAREQLANIERLGQLVGSSLSTAFSDAILEGKKLNEVLSQMLKTLAKAAINWAIMAPFQQSAGGGASPFASIFSGLFGGGGTGVGGIGAKAAGGMAGGWTLVGEKGPELVNLPHGSQVIPNDVSKNMMGSGGAIVYSPAIDARGASVEAVARLAQIMEQDRASFASRTVLTIQQARRGRIPGI